MRIGALFIAPNPLAEPIPAASAEALTACMLSAADPKRRGSSAPASLRSSSGTMRGVRGLIKQIVRARRFDYEARQRLALRGRHACHGLASAVFASRSSRLNRRATAVWRLLDLGYEPKWTTQSADGPQRIRRPTDVRRLRIEEPGPVDDSPARDLAPGELPLP